MRILMATMSLGIGGAETHIVELSKELVRRGHTVIVVSAGGSYVGELERSGVRHYELPLNVKRPDRVAKAYWGLCSLIRAEKIELVHSHARISSFICGAAAKKCGVRFVTTCHGVYDVTAFWRRLSNWGSYCLAVSYDIKQYLIENYDYPRDNIALTINGIDTERYAPKINFASDRLFDEFHLNRQSRHRLLYVSRIDIASGHVAFQLLHSAKELVHKYADLEIVLIGGGTSFEALKIETEGVNAELRKEFGRNIVTLCGPRTDVNDFLNLGNYEIDGKVHTPNTFISVSRSALEAMSSGLPTILAGSQGALGFFEASKLNLALDTNFCCRDCEASSDAFVLCECLAALSLSEAERYEYGMYNRQVILDNYSISRMADDAERVYSLPYRQFSHKKTSGGGKKYDFVLSGYYGFGNTGDDSLLANIIKRLFECKSDSRILVLSNNPRKTEATFPVKAIRRFNIPAIIHCFHHSSVLINGGGSLLQNSTSTRSLFYYTNVIKLARICGLKIMLYGSGIGPITGSHAVKMAKKALDCCDLITLRDESSLNLISKLNIAAPNVHVTADPAFSSAFSDVNWVTYALHLQNVLPKYLLTSVLSNNVSRETTKLSSNEKLPYFVVSLRESVSCQIDTDFFDRLLDSLCIISKKYSLTPIFLPMQQEQDTRINQKAAIRLKSELNLSENLLVTGLSASEISVLLANVKLAVSMRLHLLIYSASVGTPIIGFNCDPKLSGLLKTLNQPYILPLSGFDSNDFISYFDDVILKSESISSMLTNISGNLRKKTAEDGVSAVNLLS